MVYPYNGIVFSNKNIVLIHAATCLKLESIMLSERSQSQFHLYEISTGSKYEEIESRFMVA